jgi:hypothetical protein
MNRNTDSFENIFEKNLKIEIRVENYELCKSLNEFVFDVNQVEEKYCCLLVYMPECRLPLV